MDYIVKTTCGLVQGVKSKVEGIIAYKGIRYATANRFEYPKEVTSWEGIYDASKYGACSFQARAFYNEAENEKKFFYYNEFRKNEVYTYSEDCLFLNIFTPVEKKEKLPVLIYIHGGSFTGGCGHEKHFDIPVWPKKGVIGVTINYRLGPLGFMCLPELKDKDGLTGNYGLYDQLMAIKWVKHNIEAFGGDPNNITIMGQSAGAMSVQQHCLSPLSKDLFHKAVMISGGGVSSILAAKQPEKNYDFWKDIMNKCGCTTIDEFKKVNVETLFKVWQENKKGNMGGGCSPCIDGKLVIDKEIKTFKNQKQHQIPYFMGTTSHDVVPPILYSMAKNWIKGQLIPSYLYFFERNLPGDNHGAWHSSDLWYWFGTIDNCWRPFEEKDRLLMEEMTERLCAFCLTANPNNDNYINWESGYKKALVLGDNETKMDKPKTLKLWHTMFTNKAPGE